MAESFLWAFAHNTGEACSLLLLSPFPKEWSAQTSFLSNSDVALERPHLLERWVSPRRQQDPRPPKQLKRTNQGPCSLGGCSCRWGLLAAEFRWHRAKSAAQASGPRQPTSKPYSESSLLFKPTSPAQCFVSQRTLLSQRS